MKATINECREAYPALRRINEEVRLKQKAAWRISRLLGKIKAEVVDFEGVQTKLFMDAGGVVVGNSISIPPPVRAAEDDATWEDLKVKHKEKVAALGKELTALGNEEVEISYDPISMTLFEEDVKISANDLADAGPFLVE